MLHPWVHPKTKKKLFWNCMIGAKGMTLSNVYVVNAIQTMPFSKQSSQIIKEVYKYYRTCFRCYGSQFILKKTVFEKQI